MAMRALTINILRPLLRKLKMRLSESEKGLLEKSNSALRLTWVRWLWGVVFTLVSTALLYYFLTMSWIETFFFRNQPTPTPLSMLYMALSFIVVINIFIYFKKSKRTATILLVLGVALLLMLDEGVWFLPGLDKFKYLGE